MLQVSDNAVGNRGPPRESWVAWVKIPRGQQRNCFRSESRLALVLETPCVVSCAQSGNGGQKEMRMGSSALDA